MVTDDVSAGELEGLHHVNMIVCTDKTISCIVRYVDDTSRGRCDVVWPLIHTCLQVDETFEVIQW
jgi:hypothetical protein